MGKRKLQDAKVAEPEVQEAPAEEPESEVESDGDAGSASDSPVDAEPEDDSDADIKDFRKRLKGKNGRVAAAAPGAMQESANGGAAPSAAGGAAFKSDGAYRNKQRVLIFSSRGVTSRSRHLIEDMRKLIPHHKKDVKVSC